MRSKNHVFFTNYSKIWTLSLNCRKRDASIFFICCISLVQLKCNTMTCFLDLQKWQKVSFCVLKYALNVYILNQSRHLWVISNENKVLRFQKKKVHVCMTGEHFGSKKKNLNFFRLSHWKNTLKFLLVSNLEKLHLCTRKWCWAFDQATKIFLI
jgi:hypothetical protein